MDSSTIEQLAVNKLKRSILSCPLLQAFISEGDKTPSWDGEVYVYASSDKHKKKQNIYGRVPVQVKGKTSQNLSKNSISFPVKVADLNNYCNDGGVVFIVVYIKGNTHHKEHRIYYKSLLPFDLNRELPLAKGQKSKSIKLESFPEDDATAVTNIFRSFVHDAKKQGGTVDETILSLEDLMKKEIPIDGLSFETIGVEPWNVGKYLTTHEVFLYAKPQGFNIQLPIDKISIPGIDGIVKGPVTVNDEVFYSNYRITYWKGEVTVQIGKSFVCKGIDEEEVCLTYKEKGTLDERICALRFSVAMLEHEHFFLNGSKSSYHSK